MHFNTANLLFIQILYCFPLHHSENNIICPTTQSQINNVIWPSTSSLTHSQPLCVDDSKKLIQRSCRNGEWADEPLCDLYQDEIIPECDDGFTNVEDMGICYKITEPSEFETGCPFEDNITFDNYLQLIPLDSPPIWIPVTRNLDNGLGFLQWIEPNILYKTDFTRQYEIQPPFTGKNCVILYPGKGTMAAVSCLEKFSHFCAYKKLDQRESRLCRTKDHHCIQSDFSPKSKCFCVDYNSKQEEYEKVTFLKKYQNQIFSTLTNNTNVPCLIGIERRDGSYFWTSNKEPINYTNWSPDTIFDDTHVIAAMNPTGWILLESDFQTDCVLYEEEVEIVESSLILDINNETKLLRISVKNINGLKWLDERTPLLFCFTDAGAFNLIYRYPSLTIVQSNDAEMIYEFTPHAKGPGNYWCESITYPDMKPIRSNTKFYRASNFVKEFVAIIKFKYLEGIDPLSNTIVELLERVLFLKLDENEYLQSHYSARIMKIIDLDESNHFVTVNVHLTTKGNVQSKDVNDNEWEIIESILKNIFRELTALELELEEFRSVDECHQETTNEFGTSLTWNTTKVKTKAYPNEGCISVDGQPLTRLCIENFERGAEWEEITIPCNLCYDTGLTEQTDITKKLANLFCSYDSGKIKLERLNEFSRNYSEFKEVDLYFYGKILVQIEDQPKMDIVNLIDILNNLLKIDGKLLLSAQDLTHSTDRILKASNKIFTPKDLTKVDEKRPNFQIKIESVSNGCNNYDDCNFIMKLDNVELALFFQATPILQECLFILKTYINPAFFINNASNNIETIFRPVFVLNFTRSCEEHDQVFKILITYTLQEKPNKLSCDLWQPKIGSWINNVGNVMLENNVAKCQFDRVGTFALRDLNNECKDDSCSTSNPPANVTSDLSDLLESNATAHEAIEELLNISIRYEEFTEDAVYLTAKILEKFSNETDLDLNAIAEIVSNLHDVNRTVLADSQSQNQSTDLILFTVDEIINTHEYTDNVEIVYKNFFVLISDLLNISGIILYKTEDNSINYTVLNKDLEINVNDWDNVEAAVILSKDLKRQFTNDSKIIITFHTSDALFNEKENASHVVSKIFGIILPNLQEDYKGPLYVFHNISKSGWSDDCVHWYYDQITNKSGMWQSNPDRTKLGDFFQCDYWHTTHFALLLLPEDLDLPLLDLITMINCSLSGFGLASIILTAILFKRWRINTGNQILLNFVFAIAIQIATLYISNAINKNFDDDLLCTIIGVVLHYSLISQFCWMFIIAVLQFKRFVEVFGGPPKYVLVKACLCGWVLPLLPVVCVFVLDNDNYSNGHVGLCYPSGLGLYLGVWLPIVMIVVINTVIFIYILYNVLHKKTEYVSKGNSDILVQWRLAILLFFMLGLTWTFGFLGQFDYGTIFIYLFSCSATLQGFVMFLFFIVFNKNTRLMYSHGFKTCCRKKL